MFPVMVQLSEEPDLGRRAKTKAAQARSAESHEN